MLLWRGRLYQPQKAYVAGANGKAVAMWGAGNEAKGMVRKASI
jgi:hypothetical protein